MDEYIYFIQLPRGINEAVLSCADGYTIYINENLDEAGRMKAYYHARKHIDNGDFDFDRCRSADEAEQIAHR